MAYPTGMLSLTLEDVDRTALQIKAYMQARIAQCAAGSVTSSTLLDIYMRLATANDTLAAAASVSGLGDYARAQKDNAELDVIAEFTAMRAAIASAKAWLVTNLPKSGEYLLLVTLGDDRPIDREFPAAQTAGLRTVMQAVADTIG